MTGTDTPQNPCQPAAQASVETDPKLRRAIEIIIELCYRFRREKDRLEQPVSLEEPVNDSSA